MANSSNLLWVRGNLLQFAANLLKSRNLQQFPPPSGFATPPRPHVYITHKKRKRSRIGLSIDKKTFFTPPWSETSLVTYSEKFSWELCWNLEKWSNYQISWQTTECTRDLLKKMSKLPYVSTDPPTSTFFDVFTFLLL